MPSVFNARDPDSYDRMMGRWSRRLAPLFLEHGGSPTASGCWKWAAARAA